MEHSNQPVQNVYAVVIDGYLLQDVFDRLDDALQTVKDCGGKVYKLTEII